LAGEFTQLSSENTRLIAATKFNGTALLSATSTLTFQIGANDQAAEDQIGVSTTTLSLTANVFTDQGTAVNAITALDTDLNTVNAQRATFGATQTRFETVIGALQVAAENTASARSRIVDADFAQETANLTRASILQQAGTAMLAQANALPNNVLTLLRG
jgi:flagellin